MSGDGGMSAGGIFLLLTTILLGAISVTKSESMMLKAFIIAIGTFALMKIFIDYSWRNG